MMILKDVKVVVTLHYVLFQVDIFLHFVSDAVIKRYPTNHLMPNFSKQALIDIVL